MASKTVADVMSMVKENEVKFVDFRFTDTRGKEQHVTVPVSHFDEDKFTEGMERHKKNGFAYSYKYGNKKDS